MPARLRQMIPIRQFSSGRRTVVYNRMRAVAQDRQQPQLVQHIDRALAHERHTRELENRWSAQDSRLLHAEQLPAVDNRCDLVLTAIRDIAAAHAKGLPESHPVAVAVARFLDAVFPHGVAAVVSLAYIEQVLAVEAIVRTLQGDMAATARDLGLETRVQQLAEVTAEYRRLVDAGRGAVTYAQVREARARGQQYLREIIGMVVGGFYDSDDPAQAAARNALLEPVSEQLDRLHARARARVRRRGDEPAEEGDDGGDGDIDGDDGDDGDIDGDDGDIDGIGDDDLADDLGDDLAAGATAGGAAPTSSGGV